MYFSKLKLKEDNYSIFFKDRDYFTHQWVWKFFPKAPNAPRDFIFRKDFNETLPVFYVVSKRKPIDNDLFDVQVKEYNPKLLVGMQMQFDTRVNATVCKNKKDHDVWMNTKIEAKKKGIHPKQIYDYCIEKSQEWLESKKDRMGVEFEYVRFVSMEQHKDYKPKDNNVIQYSSIDYNGSLIITDVDKFRNVLFEGIGGKKGFGCGLVMVMPIS